jgi:cytochrome b
MRTYIWSIPTRVFHWLLFFGFLFAYFSGDFKHLKNIHYAFGAFAGTLILFRFIFGFVGPKYSHFKDFPIGFRHQYAFLLHPFSKDRRYAGHNPLAALVMLLILVDGLITGLTGIMVYLALHPVSGLAMNADSLVRWHKISANLLMWLFSFHLLGVLVEMTFRSKTGAFVSIFTGYKNLSAEDCRLTPFQKVYSIFWLILPFVAFYLAYGLPV